LAVWIGIKLIPNPCTENQPPHRKITSLSHASSMERGPGCRDNEERPRGTKVREPADARVVTTYAATYLSKRKTGNRHMADDISFFCGKMMVGHDGSPYPV
jgi:hypothetical protein